MHNQDLSESNLADRLLLQWLTELRLGVPMHSGPLTLVPVYGGESPEPFAYRTLADGLAAAEVVISEHARATVPSLQLTNRGSVAVLILDGEEVAGGLQNRVVNTTLLVPAAIVFDLPVSCIEHGRWHEARQDFYAGEAVHPSLRRQKTEQVTSSLAASAVPAADQSAVWAEVEIRHRRTGTRSATAALRDAYVARNDELAAAERDLTFPSDNPTGVIALVAGAAVCADLFDRPDTLRLYWHRLVRSYALEAVGAPSREPHLGSAKRLLARPAGAVRRPFGSPGLGVDLRISGNGVVGSSLIHAGSVLHTALFRQEEHPRTSMIGPRQRMRRIYG
jgi:hypothetical protein